MSEIYCQRCISTGRVAPGTALSNRQLLPDYKHCEACKLELALLGEQVWESTFEGEMGRYYGTRIIEDIRQQAQPLTRFRQLVSSNKKGRKSRKTLIFNK